MLQRGIVCSKHGPWLLEHSLNLLPAGGHGRAEGALLIAG